MSFGGIVGIVGKSSTRRVAWAWFHVVPTYGGKVIEFQSFMSSKKLEKNFYFDFHCMQ